MCMSVTLMRERIIDSHEDCTLSTTLAILFGRPAGGGLRVLGERFKQRSQE